MIKRLFWNKLAIAFLVSLFCFPSVYSAVTSVTPSGFVTDTATLLTEGQKNSLEQKLSLFNASTTNEIAVVTIKSLDGDYIGHYAEQLFKAWGIGTKKHDNGVLLLVAFDDRQMRIEVGYGLEGVLTDVVASQIIRNDLTPSFKQGDYYGGITKAVDSIIKVTNGEYVGAEKSAPSNPNDLITFFMVGVFIFQLVASFFARSKSWWAGGVVGFAAGIIQSYLTSAPFVVGGLITIAYLFVGLVLDYVVSKGKGFGSGGASFGGGFSSRGGSSFGGFGGGRSGGGGASGSW